MRATPVRSVPARIARQLERAHELNPRLNAFTHLYSPQGSSRDGTADGCGQAGSLQGTSVAVKDIFATADDAPTTCASKTLRQYRSLVEATVVKRLRRAGATLTGKTNMDEFGMGSANVHTDFGPVVNPAGPGGVEASLALPVDEQRAAGGSSGGSAAAVASGLCDVALASDTGGSTRLPAAYCGIYGFKPSYGLLSRYGMVAYASSLDTVGLMSRDASKLAQTFDALEAFEPLDPTSVPTAARERASAVHASLVETLTTAKTDRPLEGVRIGVPADLIPQPLLDSKTLLDPFRTFLASLRTLGASVTSVRFPAAPLGLSAYYVLASAEASSNLARYDGVQYGYRAAESDGTAEGDGHGEKGLLYAKTRSAGFGKEVKKRILLGTFALSADAFDNYYLQAQRVRRMIQLELDGLLRAPNVLQSPALASTAAAADMNSGVDFLVGPSALSTAPTVSSATSAQTTSSTASSGTNSSTRPDGDSSAPLQNSYLQDLLTVPASLAGLPALSLPAGRDASDGWPVGVTLMGQWGSDRAVLEVAQRWEELRKSRGEWEEGRD
ncbi:hypothetical protein BMF94_2975 [Rhodotorula taiwanensis]|uniref:Glutamyl-tRNA(Gln) amidotransferase subunit A, mitochondrial n=1 Tax=Rhodotorula taiwanensis TaxID=741276 RepID=A0A2S5BB30_9BASI|nr:hypothetical protein BMF94_2975 [Rhodotorula taiwanensis]